MADGGWDSGFETSPFDLKQEVGRVTWLWGFSKTRVQGLGFREVGRETWLWGFLKTRVSNLGVLVLKVNVEAAFKVPQGSEDLRTVTAPAGHY